jgi:hypothetical protein
MAHEAFQSLISRPYARFPLLYVSHQHKDNSRWEYRIRNLVDLLHAQGKVVWLETAAKDEEKNKAGDFIEARVAFR